MPLVNRTNQGVYLDRMDTSIGDKAKILQWVNPNDSVLDIGTGRLAIPRLLNKKYPNVEVSAIEASSGIYEEDKEYLMNNPELKCHLCKSDFFTYMTRCEKTYDCIIFCAVMHEIFSYTRFRGSYYNKDIIDEVLWWSANHLKPGGRIIIRDPIRPTSDAIVSVKIIDKELISLAEDFIQCFKGTDFVYEIAKPGFYKIPYSSVMELLYTITWGAKSFPYEVKEQLGYFNYPDWLNSAAKLHYETGMVLSHFESYLQPGYIENLKGKVQIIDERGKEAQLPDSNAILIFTKPLNDI